jgi:hypothetical protein
MENVSSIHKDCSLSLLLFSAGVDMLSSAMLLTVQVLLSLSETRPMESWLVVLGGDLKISLALAGRV